MKGDRQDPAVVTGVSKCASLLSHCHVPLKGLVEWGEVLQDCRRGHLPSVQKRVHSVKPRLANLILDILPI